MDLQEKGKQQGRGDAAVAEPEPGQVSAAALLDGADRAVERDALTEQLERVGKTRPEQVTAEQQQATMEWLMEDDGGSAEPVMHELKVDVSTDPSKEKLVSWWVKPIDAGRLGELRKLYERPSNREQRRSGVTQVDEVMLNAAVVFEATVFPELRKAMEAKQAGANGAAYVRHRFREKPMLVEHIAGQIIELSGGADDAVRPAHLAALGN